MERHTVAPARPGLADLVKLRQDGHDAAERQAKTVDEEREEYRSYAMRYLDGLEAELFAPARAEEWDGPAESLTLERIAQVFDPVRKQGADAIMVCCPVHDDSTPSLSIRRGNRSSDTADILVNCFAGCDSEEVLKTIRDMCGLR